MEKLASVVRLFLATLLWAALTTLAIGVLWVALRICGLMSAMCMVNASDVTGGVVAWLLITAVAYWVVSDWVWSKRSKPTKSPAGTP
jgi:hypothetical protein